MTRCDDGQIVRGGYIGICRAIRRDLSKDNRDGTELYFVAIGQGGAPGDSLAAQKAKRASNIQALRSALTRTRTAPQSPKTITQCASVNLDALRGVEANVGVPLATSVSVSGSSGTHDGKSQQEACRLGKNS